MIYLASTSVFGTDTPTVLFAVFLLFGDRHADTIILHLGNCSGCEQLQTSLVDFCLYIFFLRHWR
jgi:hypothetical protein